jgi:hypothetical protein
MRLVVIMVMTVIIAMLTLCYSMMSHVTLILILSCIHVNATKLLNISSTLVAMSVMVWILER